VLGCYFEALTQAIQQGYTLQNEVFLQVNGFNSSQPAITMKSFVQQTNPILIKKNCFK
jgi:hypothetical protein